MLERMTAFVWGPGLLVLLLGTGLILSVRNRFFQLYAWRRILRRTLGGLWKKPNAPSAQDGDALTQLQTFSAALAAAMGTGNIIGVAAALCLGGAGAVFWMWVSALLGMMLTYAENVLAQRYVYTRQDGTRIGGPMAYLRGGLHSRVLVVGYAVCCVAASLGMGNMTQRSAISTLAADALSIPPVAVAVGTVGLLGCILLRGAKGVGGVLQWLMPLLAAAYLLAAVAVVIRNFGTLPGALRQILCGTFGIRAVGGGISGAFLRDAVRVGLRHGVFSNEAGLGSSALVHAGGASQDGELQGLWSMVEVALDTLVCCTLIALAILTGGALERDADAGSIISAAFSSVFCFASSQVMAVLTALFAFCTLIGWCCCGEQAIRYLFGRRGAMPYRVLFCLAAGVGALLSLHTV